MKIQSCALIVGVVAVAVTLMGCATSHDYDIDVDALLRQLEMDAGMDGGQVVDESAPASTGTAPKTPAPSTAVSAAAAPSVQPAPPPPVVPPGELTIQPDCMVEVSVAEDPALNGSYTVNEIGAVNLGYVGPVILYNKTEAQAAEKITEILTSRHFRNATVQVRIIRASYDKVRVGGEVLSPGLIKIGAGDAISLNDALLRAGGLKPSARGAKVKVVRNGLRSATAPTEDGEIYSLIDAEGQPTMPDVVLYNNDVAFVFISVGDSDDPVIGEAACKVVLLGEVREPGVYPFKAGQPCTMLNLMFRVVGQMTPYANQKKVMVIRKNDQGWDEEFRINVEALMKDGDPALDIQLQDGDRVVVPKRRVSLF